MTEKHLYFRCPKCQLGQREHRISLETFVIAEYQINCDYCDTPETLVGTDSINLTIKSYGTNSMVEIRLWECGYYLHVTDSNGLSQYPMRTNDGMILYDNPGKVSRTTRKYIERAFRWMDQHRTRIGFCSDTELELQD